MYLSPDLKCLRSCKCSLHALLSHSGGPIHQYGCTSGVAFLRGCRRQKSRRSPEKSSGSSIVHSPIEGHSRCRRRRLSSAVAEVDYTVSRFVRPQDGAITRKVAPNDDQPLTSPQEPLECSRHGLCAADSQTPSTGVRYGLIARWCPGKSLTRHLGMPPAHSNFSHSSSTYFPKHILAVR